MKKFFYLFLVIPFFFASCSKDDDDNKPSNNNPSTVNGCTDPDATNYNASATSDDGTCMYDITDAVWTMTLQTIDGANVLDPTIISYVYLWADGTFGWEDWDIETLDIVDWGGGPNDGGYWTTPAQNVITVNDGIEFNFTFAIDIMTNNDEMTWTATNGDGSVMTIGFTRSSRDINSWK